MLVQNPPSIPTLLIAGLVCQLRGTRLVIDWHNFGYSILGLKLGEEHFLVKIARWYEFKFARLASAHLAVSNVMAREIKTRVGTPEPILTLHDRPASLFQPMSNHDRLSFLQRYPLLGEHFTHLVEGKAKLIVSSTSWTADEDFSLLLEGLCEYAKKTREHPRLPELIVVITGKGPQKQHYLAKIKELKQQDALEQVTIYTDWLSFQDYASLLGVADLGVSLHTSSSGLDLPMKVVDMFGAGLPVLGWSDFEAWSELVTENVNGKGFRSSVQLAEILSLLFQPDTSWLSKLKAGAIQESKRRWDEEWDPVAGRFFGLT
jgi:beta-1,4-mannosyltransferase